MKQLRRHDAMASRFRSILTSGALALFVLATAASAAFAAGPAEPYRYTFGDDYCFVDVNMTYCFEQDGALHFVETPDGRSLATINHRQITRFYQNGQLVGESREVSVDKSLFEDGGLGTFQTVSHTNTRYGEVKCVLTTVLKIVDYEVEVDHWNSPECS
jgi:hypothetical protein